MQQASHNLKPEDQCDSTLDSFPPSSLLLTFLWDYITIPHQCSDISSPILCVRYWPCGSRQQGHRVQRSKQASSLHLNIGCVGEEKEASIQLSGSGKHCDVFGLLTMTSRHIEDHCIGKEHVQRKGGWKRPFTVQAILSLLRSHTAYDVFTLCLIQIISYAVMMIYSMIHRKGFQTLTLNMTE